MSGYLVLIPAKHVDLELNPVQCGLMDGVRQLAGGATSMTGGFLWTSSSTAGRWCWR